MSNCPHCGKYNPLHENMADPDDVPEVGDVALCIGCGKFSVFLSHDRVRKPTAAELKEFAVDANCQANLRAWQEMKVRLLRS